MHFHIFIVQLFVFGTRVANSYLMDLKTKREEPYNKSLCGRQI